MALDQARLAVISHNVASVRQRIGQAAARSGRKPEDIELIAVTKYVEPDDILALVSAGCRNLGESRPQNLWRKAELLESRFANRLDASGCDREEISFNWHLIGHLQRNKIRRTLPYIPYNSWIHSVDSLQLLEAIDKEATSMRRWTKVLLEVNVSGDATKTGFRPDELEPLVPRLEKRHSVEIGGLMCMAARDGDLDVARRNFCALRELRDRMARSFSPLRAFRHLSMGMSSDFEVAIEEGATMVRVGSALFEGLPP